jgi:NADPH:quinone reductase-like Zn-dependent oxidoreductase
MKAVQIERFGGPEVLRATEIPAPEPRDSEILVEIEAAGVNWVDLLTRRGVYHRGGQPPMVLGIEGSGVVRSDDKVSWALGNGADHGINYSKQDVLSETLSITAGAGVEVVLDAVGELASRKRSR